MEKGTDTSEPGLSHTLNVSKGLAEKLRHGHKLLSFKVQYSSATRNAQVFMCMCIEGGAVQIG